MLLAAAPEQRPDWTLVVDDDVGCRRLPRPLPRLCEAFALDLAQPAQTLRSHSAWKVTRRRPAALARSTRFVEIGPVTAFQARAGGGAAAVPGAALRLGTRPALGRAGRRARLATRRGGRGSGAPRGGTVAAGYRAARREEEARASSPSGPTSRASAGDTLAVHRRAPLAVRLLFVCPDMRTGGAERPGRR